jgi:hypothetical protein
MSPAYTLVDGLDAVRVHPQQPSDALLLPLGRVVDVRPAPQHAGVDAHVDELAAVPVGHDLEGQRGHPVRLLVGGPLDRIALEIGPDHRGQVDRGRQVVDDRVEETLDAAVLERRAADDGDDVAPQRGRADRGLELVDADLLAGAVRSRRRCGPSC